MSLREWDSAGSVAEEAIHGASEMFDLIDSELGE